MNLPPNSLIAAGPVIIENRDGQLQTLLNKHKPTAAKPEPKWQFCGGEMENFDRTVAATASREVKEEMGIDIEIEKIIDVYLQPKKDKGLAILVHFLARRLGEITPAEDIESWGWFPLDRLPADRQPNVDYIINKIKNG